LTTKLPANTKEDWSNGTQLLMQFKVGSAFRKVTTRSATRDEIESETYRAGERVREHDTGAVFSATVLWAALVRGSTLGPVLVGSKWKGQSPEVDDKILELTCNATECVACVGKGCTAPPFPSTVKPK
jgi:hypothetical protein